MTDSVRTVPINRRQLLLTLGAAGASAAAGNLFPPLGQGGKGPPDGLHIARRTGFALGADISITALHQRRNMAEQALRAAFAEVETVQSLMSLYHPQSQLCRLNREGALLKPHPYLVRVLEKALAVSAASDGDFDITVQPLWAVYASAKQNLRLPDAEDIARARRRVDWRRVDVSPKRIRLLGNGTAVTLNGIAQGFATDCALAALASHGVRHALVNTGEIGALGRRRDGELWTVGIRHPRRQDAYIRRARLEGRCLATSGDYATTFSPDRTHNHIFDPHTGRSPRAFQSVTVLARSGLEADALSTAVFVAGLPRGITLIEATPGADALLVLKGGEALTTSSFPGPV